MGKYDKKKGIIDFRLCIANELAEANRLKRLDMRNDYLVYDDIDEDEFKKLLEDKA